MEGLKIAKRWNALIATLLGESTNEIFNLWLKADYDANETQYLEQDAN
jgi:hypothetical protein